MDAYPEPYVAHNLPLIVLSGLGTVPARDTDAEAQNCLEEDGATIRSDVPEIAGERVNQLLQDFLGADGRDAPWNSRTGKSKSGLTGFRLRAVGREFRLPARKASPPSFSPTLSPPGSPTASSTPSLVLHSPISPLSPRSPIYPDGVMTPLWVAKHQHHVPAVFISFFTFTSDPNRNILHDNQLKSEINGTKGSLSKSGYKTRYVVVLLSDKTILEAPDIEERLALIRRATGLDPKYSLFFLPPNASRVEVASFVHTILLTLQPVCVEYYRDLTKHARRKKARGQIPPPTAPPTKGTSQTLTAQGWDVRYEYKLGIFAEYRQEMDAAGRHYTFAFDSLLGPDGIFEMTTSWSPRWKEARLLADTIALRILRCQLWNNLPTGAVQSWVNYRDRIRDLVDRRGKGSNNYGWEAWESRWTKVMAEIIHRAEMPVFAVVEPSKNLDVIVDQQTVVYAPPEKSIPVGERLRPWEYLHHAGYWLSLSAQHAKSRRQLAEDIPDEDRTPPGQSSATQVANRYGTYDTYLCPEPHMEYALPGRPSFDHTADIVDTLNQAISEFYARNQQRSVDKLQLDVGTELMRAGNFTDALSVLKPLWEGMSWRKERWWTLVFEVTLALYDCARRVQDSETLVATQWELLSNSLPLKDDHAYDLVNCLEAPKKKDHVQISKPKVLLTAQSIACFLSTSFTFERDEGYVGEPVQSQLAVTSCAHSIAAPVTLSRLNVQFEGFLRQVEIQHKAATNQHDHTSNLVVVALQETIESTSTKQHLVAEADLTFYPQQSKVFSIPIVFREAGDARAVSVTFEIETERFALSCSSTVATTDGPPLWWLKGRDRLKTKRIGRDNGSATKILPKPPKVEIRLPNLQSQYYTDEPVVIDIELLNKEDDETEAVLEVRFLGRSEETLDFSWVTDNDLTNVATDSSARSLRVDLPGHPIGRLPPGAQRTQSIALTATSFPSDFVLEVKVLYHLLSDLDTPVSKILTADIIFVGPFEANYDFAPRVHPDAWPSYFSVEDARSVQEPGVRLPSGIAQRWCLTAKIASFADEVLAIEAMDLAIQSVTGESVCSVIDDPSQTISRGISPHELHERTFGLDVRKLNLDDRRSSNIEAYLSITWRRKSNISNKDSTSIISTLPIPRLVLPTLEPRVLLSTRPSSTPSLIQLDYTLENPTMHFLTFDLTMEASEDFAFSGPKLRAVNLLPVSRQTVRFHVLPLVRGVWIVPQLKVVDRYFNKTLKVLGAEGVRMDKKGVMVWVDEEEVEGRKGSG